MTAPRTAEAQLTEIQFQQQVRDLATLTGWIAYHTHDSRRSDAGFPDLVLVNPKQRRVVYAELKSQTGRVRDVQRTWLKMLAAAGQEVALWRPADLEAIKAILRGQSIPTNRAAEAFQ